MAAAHLALFKGVEGRTLEVFLVKFVKFRWSVSSDYGPNRILSLSQLDFTGRKARVRCLKSSGRRLGPLFRAWSRTKLRQVIRAPSDERL